jgi:hypothetical protein
MKERNKCPNHNERIEPDNPGVYIITKGPKWDLKAIAATFWKKSRAQVFNLLS